MSTQSRKLVLGRKDDRPGVVADTGNPSTWEVEPGGSFQGQLHLSHQQVQSQPELIPPIRMVLGMN